MLKPHLTAVNVADGFLFWDSGQSHTFSVFPVSGLVSITVRFANGDCIGVATIGPEGATSAGSRYQANNGTQACAFIGGEFLRIATSDLLSAAQSNEEIARLLECCQDWLLAQCQQTAACNAVHSAEQRLCRWLAQSCERLGTTTLAATQDGIASLLGIRRTTVTLLAQALQEQGLISYRRGRIAVADIERLKSTACECCGSLDSTHWPSTQLKAPPFG